MFGCPRLEIGKSGLLRFVKEFQSHIPEPIFLTDRGRFKSYFPSHPRWNTTWKYDYPLEERSQCLRHSKSNCGLLPGRQLHRSQTSNLYERGRGVLDLESDHRKVLAVRLLLKYGWCIGRPEGSLNLHAASPTKALWALTGKWLLPWPRSFPMDSLPIR